MVTGLKCIYVFLNNRPFGNYNDFFFLKKVFLKIVAIKFECDKVRKTKFHCILEEYLGRLE